MAALRELKMGEEEGVGAYSKAKVVRKVRHYYRALTFNKPHALSSAAGRCVSGAGVGAAQGPP